ncbi:Uncharacterised protein [Campylobacter jejuni subsp. doylei]|nr:Uncharacterised protein [Campylobacter jejuni subsp. doylei]VEJ46973.1 Uncharacterised protein [Campylobacter jejuni subsp. doylei]
MNIVELIEIIERTENPQNLKLIRTGADFYKLD